MSNPLEQSFCAILSCTQRPNKHPTCTQCTPLAHRDAVYRCFTCIKLVYQRNPTRLGDTQQYISRVHPIRRTLLTSPHTQPGAHPCIRSAELARRTRERGQRRVGARGADECEGIGGRRAEEEGATPTAATVRCTVRGTWRASVYYRLQESPHVTEIEIHSRNSAKQT